MPNPTTVVGRPHESPGRVFAVLAFTILAQFLILAPVIRLSDWHVPSTNTNVMEAMAWRAGRLELFPDLKPSTERRPNDTAWINDRVYNVFPPLVSFLSYAALTVQAWQGEDPSSDLGPDNPKASIVYAPWYVLLVFWPLPIVGFWAARESILAVQAGAGTNCGAVSIVSPSVGAAIITLYWLLATPLTQLLYFCQNAATNELNHVLCGTGLMLVAGDLVHRRRMWPAAIGLIISLWTRQLTVFYLGALLWLVVLGWRYLRTASHAAASPSAPFPGSAGIVRRGLLAATVVMVIGGGAIATLNTLKFGSPLNSGYSDIYNGREKDLYARRWMTYQKLFDVRFVPENFYWMNLSPPTVEVRRMMVQINGEGDGTAIWITCPLLLFVFVSARSWWADPARRALMLATLPLMAALLCYHNTGSLQRGYHRFTMDFVPIWLIVIAPFALTRRATPLTLLCLAYGSLYFHFLCRN